MKQRSYDVLIIGSGAAGMRAAIAAREQGVRVGVLSKGSPGKKTATILSGGVFAGSVGASSPDAHRHQTLKAGRGINQMDLVDALVTEGPERLEELMNWGIEGGFHEGYLFVKGRPPLWGSAIVDCLVSRCRGKGIDFHPNCLVTKLLPRQSGFEVLAYNPAIGDSFRFNAKAVVLATGGSAALFERHDNPGRMLGDGWVLALEAGAVLQDLEFVQFYPLGLYEPGLPGFLIPPRLADQGRLFNQAKEDIYSKYDIKERPAGEKARDRLSQALFNEVYIENGSVWMDASKLSESQWCDDPFSASTFDLLGNRYGARHRPVRIAPMAHHTMGGVMIDPRGATSVPGLFAAGEVTGGLHGANRMGGNALTETVVFGKRAGEAAAVHTLGLSDNSMRTSDNGIDDSPSKSRNPSGYSSKDISAQLESLRHEMWAHGGIVRDADGLEQLLKDVSAIQAQANRMVDSDPRRTLQLLELRFASKAAGLIIAAALKRTESRGAHYRQDHPEQNDTRWQVHQQVQQLPDGVLDWRVVHC